MNNKNYLNFNVYLYISINFMSVFLFVCQMIKERWNATENLHGKGHINEMRVPYQFWLGNYVKNW